jgi:DNA-binding NtrC family response regulator
VRPLGDARLLASALIVQGRMLLVIKETQASIEALNQALSLQNELTRQQKAQCYIFLAESYHGFHVTRGQEFLDQATRLIEGQQDAALKAEYDGVINKYRRERVVVSGENKFIIDGNLLPEWEDAKRGLEIFLLRNALKQSENNMTQAGKLLGISKVHVHTRRKQYGL